MYSIVSSYNDVLFSYMLFPIEGKLSIGMVNQSMAGMLDGCWVVEVVWGVWLASATVLEMDLGLDLGGSDFVGPCYGSGVHWVLHHFVYALFSCEFNKSDFLWFCYFFIIMHH